MNSFKNKTVYIFGGSSGIGLSTAELLVSACANVIIFGRNISRLKNAYKKIKKILPYTQKVSYLQIDVRDYKYVNKTINKAIKNFGLPDIVINCVGKALPNYFEKISNSQFEDIIKTNLGGSWNIAASIYKTMKGKECHIVFVSSIAGFLGVFGYSDYCASKFAIIGLAETLKIEFRRRNIKLSVLCPPDTNTSGYHHENKTKPIETKEISKNTKLLEPDFVAKKLLEGIKKNKFIIIPGFKGKLSYFVKRFFPFFIDYILYKSIKNVSKKNSL